LIELFIINSMSTLNFAIQTRRSITFVVFVEHIVIENKRIGCTLGKVQ